MKVALDVQPLLDKQKTGVGWYTKMLIDTICEDPETSVQLNYAGYRMYRKQRDVMDVYRRSGIKVRHSWLPVKIRRKLGDLRLVPYHLLFGKKADVTIFFNYEIPYGVKGKRIVVIHDMTYKAYPETVNCETKKWLELVVPSSCKRADRIVTLSNHGKSEIIKYLGIKEDKIDIVPCGVDFGKYNCEYTFEEVEAARHKYEIPSSYYLYIGTLEPRKNITCLIEAYAKLIRLKPDAPSLVIGGKKGWMYDELFLKVKECNMEKQVIFTGYLSDNDVPRLMCGALGFLFPSLYEGFGIPPLEAMACGTPVIVSNAASLPEVIGDAGLLVEPNNYDMMCNAMLQLAENKKLRDELQQKGMIQAQKYTWKLAAQKMRDIYLNM